jgi:hypothetical protein
MRTRVCCRPRLPRTFCVSNYQDTKV